MPSDSDLLFGKLAVSRGFCAPESLEWCIAIQATGTDRVPLGRILVNEGYLTEEQHSEILALQRKNLSAADSLVKKSKESMLFGKLVVREKLLSAVAVNECLAEQAREGEKRSLGEIMVSRGLLTAGQVQDLLRKQQKKIMTCPACSLSFTVFTISQGKKAISCPKCKGALTDAKPTASPRTDAEFSTQVLHATKRELPPGSLEDSRVIPPNAVRVKTQCVVCDQPIEEFLDSTGRVRCTTCRTTFVPR